MKLLTPNLYLDNLTDLTVDILKEEGISYLLIDLDDTLVASYADSIAVEFEVWLKQLAEQGIGIFILSNGKFEHVRYWLEYLQLEGIALAAKPLPIGWARALKLLNARREHCAMLGDQLFTDVLGANIYGIHSILVKPLSPGKPHTKQLRKLERYCLGKMNIS